MARTSLYSQFLKPVEASVPGGLPGWVTGSEFGDIQRNINQTEMSYGAVEAQDQLNQLREQQVLENERRIAFQDDLARSFAEEKPQTMRDAYNLAQSRAFSLGFADQALQMGEQVQRMEDQERARKIQAYSMAPNLLRANMDGAASNVLTLAGIDPASVLTPEAIAANQRLTKMGGATYGYDEEGNRILIAGPAGRGSGEGKEYPGGKELWHEQTGERVIARNAAEALAYRQAGYSDKQIDPLDAMLKQKMLADFLAKEKGGDPESNQGSWSLANFLGLASNKATTKSDKPSVGDSVRLVVRNREVRK